MLIELAEPSILQVECASILPESSLIRTDAAWLFQRTTVATRREEKATTSRRRLRALWPIHVLTIGKEIDPSSGLCLRPLCTRCTCAASRAIPVLEWQSTAAAPLLLLSRRFRISNNWELPRSN